MALGRVPLTGAPMAAGGRFLGPYLGPFRLCVTSAGLITVPPWRCKCRLICATPDRSLRVCDAWVGPSFLSGHRRHLERTKAGTRCLISRVERCLLHSAILYNRQYIYSGTLKVYPDSVFALFWTVNHHDVVDDTLSAAYKPRNATEPI